MGNSLLKNWSGGIALGELSSSFMLMFCILASTYIIHKNKKYSESRFILPGLFAISIIISSFIGWGLGSHVTGRGTGLALANPVLAIVYAVHYDAYTGLWYILLFEFIGTLIGGLAFALYIKLNNLNKANEEKDKVSDYLFLGSEGTKTAIYKNLFFQPLFIIMLIAIPGVDFTSYQTGMIINTMLVALGIFMILSFAQPFNFFMFSPFITITTFILGYKKVKKEHIYNFIYALLIQLSFIAIISGINLAWYIKRGLR